MVPANSLSQIIKNSFKPSLILHILQIFLLFSLIIILLFAILFIYFIFHFSEDYVKDMWRRVRKDDPVMRSNFENFISKMSADMKQTVSEKETLENALKR